MSDRHHTLKESFGARAEAGAHPLSNYLYRLMELKSSNLCLSADVTTARDLIHIADKLGPSIVVLKTHYDLISGWDYNPQTGTGAKLATLARKHGFLIFEDRKFCDIGKTVQMQYTAGTARIIEWAHITNVNIDAGKEVVRALAEAAARWHERINYEVKTSVTVGTPISDTFDDINGTDEGRLDPKEQSSAEESQESGYNGRKGSIVSITTVTQSYEMAGSPRLSKTILEGDDMLYPGIEEAPMDRGLLILAQMSTKGCLMTKEYTQACIEAAREHRRFVMGYVAQECLNSEPDDDFIHMTPGCKLPPAGEEENGQLEGDGLGQQYNTPAKLIGIKGTDIVIVGRGIITADDPKCDRKLPCTNCVSRNKRESCKYDTAAPTLKGHRATSSGGDADNSASARENPGDSIPTKVANFGYSATGASTLGFLRKIEGANPAEPLSALARDAGGSHADHLNMRERYKSLIRQLPARTYIDKLVDVYFHDFNWMYHGLDRDVFDKQLAEWFSLPFNLLTNGGPQALSPDMRSFPALLFQVLATALLVLPSGHPDATFDSLKYAGNMTFEDLAMDYSESGVAICSLLGKRQMSITTVLAGFVRASFLKYVALVTESWHAIGSAIRDAQEVGLHRDSLDPKPASDDAEAVLENQWEIQRRRKVWMLLLGWDLHTGVVLGRPTTVSHSTPPTLPVDAPLPKDRSRTPIQPRGDNDPPTPLTRAIWAYTVMRPLRDIIELESEGPCPKDFSKVDAIHQKLLDLEDQTPAYFRLENPDKRFDHLPECHWLPSVRASLPQLIAFNVMALHRPYIFTRAKSRTEALKSSLKALESQALHFQSLGPQQYKTFSLFFGTFDAIVLMASIYILFPKEQPELVQTAMQHFQWAVERFEAMSERNALARAALGVLHAIHIRLKKSLNFFGSVSATPLPALLLPPTPAATSGGGSDNASPDAPLGGSSTSASVVGGQTGSSSLETPTTASSGGEFYGGGGDGNGGNNSGGFDWNLPNGFDWASIQPIFATGDLVYNDLVGIPDGSEVQQWGGGLGGGLGAQQQQGQQQQPWQFEGDFGNDSVWNLLNQYTPL
ncbi:OMPdecase-domain-containing protein [Coniochaeta ligniaria NRRL 30616]|uniref:Orotidine 5'-phosphate decarboxylase n=1 Tax=Coniochaeta ligniaria NRRL 30616 TaxID=1408157 RepID=A0A1J7IK69_9PEZI|nr:OMPdecase-domain-containing protein [Coniochaeta ligniaria NRRL 30616]